MRWQLVALAASEVYLPHFDLQGTDLRHVAAADAAACAARCGEDEACTAFVFRTCDCTDCCTLKAGAHESDCEAMCAALAGCNGYTYAPSNCSGASGPICWTKGRLSGDTETRIITLDQGPLLQGQQ